MSLASKGMNRGLIAGVILSSDLSAAARPSESESADQAAVSAALAYAPGFFSFLAAVGLSVTPSVEMLKFTPWTTCSFAGCCALDGLVRKPSAAKRSWKESMAESPRWRRRGR